MLKEFKISVIISLLLSVPSIIFLSQIATLNSLKIVLFLFSLFFVVLYIVEEIAFIKLKKQDNLKFVRDKYVLYIQKTCEALILLGMIAFYIELFVNGNFSSSIILGSVMFFNFKLCFQPIYIGDNFIYTGFEKLNLKDIKNSKKEELQTKNVLHKEVVKYTFNINKKEKHFSLYKFVLSKENENLIDAKLLV